MSLTQQQKEEYRQVLERTGTWTYVCDHCGHSRQDCAKETQYVHHP